MPVRVFDTAFWSTKLRNAGLRVTRSRLAVVQALVEAPTPSSALDVLATIGGAELDRVTVYRTLNSLVDHGLAHRIDPGDRIWRYGLIGEAHEEHAHFVCDACGEIKCLEDAMIRVTMKGGKEPENFTVTQRDVYLHGTCERCTDRPSAAPRR
jgi:Fur family ferric uptake transcriptional regulator